MAVKEMYLVMLLTKTAEVNVRTAAGSNELELSWADGMIGAMPVFDSFEKADAFAPSNARILTVGLKEEIDADT